MQVAIWDTYVTKKDGTIMLFDIIVPADINDSSIIYGYGKAYLSDKQQEGQSLSSKECKFCHIEHVKSDLEKEIKENGFYIYEMENCE